MKERFQAVRTQLQQKSSFVHWTSDRLRWDDTDSWGHIKNTLYAVFCDSGCHAFNLEHVHPLRPADQNLMVVRVTINFEGESFFPNDIAIGTVPLWVSNSSYGLGHGLFIGERIVATAETVLVNVNHASRKSAGLPDAVRATLARLLLP